MSKILVVATATILHNWNQRFEATGRYDAFGNMLMKAKGESIAPGTLFEMEEGDDLDSFRGLEAVRDPSQTERIMWERDR